MTEKGLPGKILEIEVILADEFLAKPVKVRYYKQTHISEVLCQN